jgi:hypothetical protein
MLLDKNFLEPIAAGWSKCDRIEAVLSQLKKELMRGRWAF